VRGVTVRWADTLNLEQPVTQHPDPFDPLEEVEEATRIRVPSGPDLSGPAVPHLPAPNLAGPDLSAPEMTAPDMTPPAAPSPLNPYAAGLGVPNGPASAAPNPEPTTALPVEPAPTVALGKSEETSPVSPASPAPAGAPVAPAASQASVSPPAANPVSYGHASPSGTPVNPYGQVDAPSAEPTFGTPPQASGYASQPQPGYGQQPQPGYAPQPQPGYGQQPQPGYGPVGPQAKSRLAAGLLGIFLGWLGIHRFYLGYTGIGVTMLLLSVLSLGFLSPFIAVWGLVEGILYLTAKGGSYSVDSTGRPLTS
jgi:TM2 domain-containing membrane protein YozV